MWVIDQQDAAAAGAWISTAGTVSAADARDLAPRVAQGPASAVPGGQIVDVDVVRGVAGQDLERALLGGRIGRADPQQQPAPIELLLQMLGLVLAEPAGQDRADQRPGQSGAAAATTPAEATTVPAATTAGR